MKSKKSISKLLLLAGSAPVLLGTLEKPSCAAPVRLIQAVGQNSEAEKLREQYRGALYFIALKLNQIPAAQRLSYFYNVKARFFGIELQPESSVLDTTIQPDGTFTNPNAAILVDPLLKDGALTPTSITLFRLAQFLPLSPRIIADFSRAFPKRTSSAQKLKKWSDSWVNQYDVAALAENDNRASSLVLTLAPLGAEERAQMLCKIAGVVSPEAGNAYSQFYSAEKVKVFVTQIDNVIASPVPVGFSREVFDNTVEKLPPHFQGNDISLIMSKSTNRKDEFETTTVYTRRVNLTIAQEIGLKGEWTNESVFAVIVNKERAFVRYDADTEIMSLSSELDTDNGCELQSHFRSFMKIANPTQFPYSTWAGQYTGGTSVDPFKIKMSPETAREVKAHLRVLILFRLNRPGYESDKWPSFTATVREIWAFNVQTGDVYEKWVAR